MPALSGSLTYTQYFVDNLLAQDPATTYAESIKARRFIPLSTLTSEFESVGWVPTEDPYNDERPLSPDLWLFGDICMLTYREDKFAVNAAVLKRETRKKLERIATEENKALSDMTKSFKKAVQQSVLNELRAKSMPRTKTIDVVWLWNKREVRVFGGGNAVRERIKLLFERTFGVQLMAKQPGPRALAITFDQAELERLDVLTPTVFFSTVASVRQEAA